MLINERRKRLTWFLILTIAFLVMVLFFNKREENYCLGVPTISQEKLNDYSPMNGISLSTLTINDEPVAADLASNTIYLSQYAGNLSRYRDLKGNIESVDRNVQLYFLEDNALKNLETSVSESCPLTLVAVHQGGYQLINVVITTLPLIVIDGFAMEQDEMFGDYLGHFTIHCGFDPSFGGPSFQSSEVIWHRKGQLSAYDPKGSFKLSLKDEQLQNKDLNLLGLGSDDDWILNGMVFDDTRLKEKFAMDLWNTMAEYLDYEDKMSCGEYVEVIMNGEYRGLYLLQRRVDAKYLELDDRDILLKGYSMNYLPLTGVSSFALYETELISSPYSLEESNELLFNIIDRLEGGKVELEHYLNVNLFINYIVGADNSLGKNIYYLLKYTDEGYLLYLIPWDTDMTFGVFWKSPEIPLYYDLDSQLQRTIYRYDSSRIQEYYEDFNTALSERWKRLRETIYTRDNVVSLLQHHMDTLSKSGALERDFQKNEIRFDGKDNWENLFYFITERLNVMDILYDS